MVLPSFCRKFITRQIKLANLRLHSRAPLALRLRGTRRGAALGCCFTGAQRQVMPGVPGEPHMLPALLGPWGCRPASPHPAGFGGSWGEGRGAAMPEHSNARVLPPVPGFVPCPAEGALPGTRQERRGTEAQPPARGIFKAISSRVLKRSDNSLHFQADFSKSSPRGNTIGKGAPRRAPLLPSRKPSSGGETPGRRGELGCPARLPEDPHPSVLRHAWEG